MEGEGRGEKQSKHTPPLIPAYAPGWQNELVCCLLLLHTAYRYCIVYNIYVFMSRAHVLHS